MPNRFITLRDGVLSIAVIETISDTARALTSAFHPRVGGMVFARCGMTSSVARFGR